MPDNLAICILFFERVEQTEHCLRDFARAGIPIYVLNNGSAKASLEDLQARLLGFPNITFLNSPKNLGVAAGRNRLVRETTEPWLLFLDSDIRVEGTQWLASFEQYRARFPEAEAFVAKLYNSHEAQYSLTYRFHVRDGALHCESVLGAAATNGFPGGAAFVARSLFNRLGGYDEAMFVGFEDYEYAVRGILTGEEIRARVIPEITFIHSHERAQCQQDKDAARVRYHFGHIENSYLHFTKKWGITYSDSWRRWVRQQQEKIESF